MKHDVYNNKFQLLTESKSTSHLPSRKILQLKKKNIIRWIWINAILLSLLIACMITEVWEKLDQNRFATLFTWLLLSALATLLYVFSAYQSIYLKFRQTKREVRKLIFQDLLLQLKKEKMVCSPLGIRWFIQQLVVLLILGLIFKSLVSINSLFKLYTT